MLVGALLGLAGAAQPVLGVTFSPLAAFVTAADDTALERTARPPLTAYGGARLGRVSLLGSLGVASQSTVSRAEGVTSRQRLGLVRPGLDVRVALLNDPQGVPEPFLLAGAHVTVPLVADVSDGFTDEEREAAREAAQAERRRRGRLGGRLGAGALVRLHPSIGLGAQYTIGWERSFARQGPGTVTHDVVSDASLIFELTW